MSSFQISLRVFQLLNLLAFSVAVIGMSDPGTFTAFCLLFWFITFPFALGIGVYQLFARFKS